MLALITFALSGCTSFAESLYVYQHGKEHYALNRDKGELSLASEGMTYRLPIDACTKADVDFLLTTLNDNFQRLIKPEKDWDTGRLGTVTMKGDSRVLKELAIHESAPEYFSRLPSRFVNLMMTQNGKCPRSFL